MAIRCTDQDKELWEASSEQQAGPTGHSARLWVMAGAWSVSGSFMNVNVTL